jgi:hypothetical protein
MKALDASTSSLAPGEGGQHTARGVGGGGDVLAPAAAICRFCSRLHLEAHGTERVRNINSE